MNTPAPSDQQLELIDNRQGGPQSHSEIWSAPRTIGVGAAVCVIIPTRNEAGNIDPLMQRLNTALVDHDAEVLFVDDSDDDTPAVVRSSAGESRLPVRLLHRERDERHGGLGGAVLAGLKSTHAPWAVVMDGDLQHPPEAVPALLEAGRISNLDVVAASRYTGDGDARGLASGFRVFASSGASAVAKLVFPRRLADVSDPLTGFFALRTATVDAASLRPRGFKILLEILARTPELRAGEVPFRFAPRQSGRSKASLREAARFLVQLVILRTAQADRSRRLLRFGLVGASGFAVNLVALWLLLAVPFPWPAAALDSASATVAAQVALLWNFLLTERWVFAGQSRVGSWSTRLAVFWILGVGSLLAQLPMATGIQVLTGVSYLQATAVALVVLAVIRFTMLDRVLYDASEPDGLIVARLRGQANCVQCADGASR